jgi:hypothetical protein
VASGCGRAGRADHWGNGAVPPGPGRRRGVTHALRSAPWLDRIRHRPEFQAWLRESEERMAAQRRELAALGPWTPEAVLGSEGR